MNDNVIERIGRIIGNTNFIVNQIFNIPISISKVIIILSSVIYMDICRWICLRDFMLCNPSNIETASVLKWLHIEIATWTWAVKYIFKHCKFITIISRSTITLQMIYYLRIMLILLLSPTCNYQSTRVLFARLKKKSCFAKR